MAAAGCPVCCTEPIPAPLALERHVHFVPRYSRSAAIAQARQTLDEYGPPRALSITALTEPGLGSVAARLYDSIELAVSLTGPIESVHGRFSTRQHPLPDEPRAITGQIALALRFDSGAVGSALVGHCASPWLRSCLVTNEAGVIMADDIACQWHSTQRVIRLHTIAIQRSSGRSPMIFASLIKSQTTGVEEGRGMFFKESGFSCAV